MVTTVPALPFGPTTLLVHLVYVYSIECIVDQANFNGTCKKVLKAMHTCDDTSLTSRTHTLASSKVEQ